MISKELLSEVLGINVTEVYFHDKQGLKYKTHRESEDGWESSSDVPMPNIYELAHKCKEWALDNGIMLESAITKRSGLCHTGTRCHNNELYNPELFMEDTEPEAIFRACEWIIDNKDIQ